MKRLIWIRGKDLRVDDHPALSLPGPKVCVFVLDPYFFSPKRAQGMANRIAFVLESLHELRAAIEQRGGQLLILEGRGTEVIPRLARTLGVEEVAALRWTEPFARKRDQIVARALHVPFRLCEGETLLHPGCVRTKADTPFSVFTPYHRAFTQAFDLNPPTPAPEHIATFPIPGDLQTTAIPTPESLGLSCSPLRLTGGETRAQTRLDTFLRQHLATYDTDRDRLAEPATSRLSQDLKFGTLSVRRVWFRATTEHPDSLGQASFLRQLVWREFAHSCLWHRPNLLHEPFRPRWSGFPWSENPEHWDRWVSGHTGFPIVDAASRQLLATGFVHNRARMVAASFLTKHLQIHYQRGEAHYMAHLTDGDWAQNNAGWQWAQGCGCDAQPWFRIFNPMRQGQRFDPDGTYVRRWVPELAQLDKRTIHAPWTASPSHLQQAGVTLGRDYPHPIVDHAQARQAFLQTAKLHLQT